MYLISAATPPEMYELYAPSKEERRTWMSRIQQTAARSGPQYLKDSPLPPSTPPPVTPVPPRTPRLFSKYLPVFLPKVSQQRGVSPH